MKNLEEATTFGEALQFCRIQARFKTLEQFAEALETSSPGQVSRWERNIILPTPETINRIALVCHLTHHDHLYLLGMARYLPQRTTLPPITTVTSVLERLCSHIQTWMYPAYITDFRMRCWAANAACTIFTHENRAILEHIAALGVNTFDLSFRRDLAPRDSTMSPEETQEFQMFRFKANNLYRRHEPFYKGYLAYMEGRLQPEEFHEFAESWRNINPAHMTTFRLEMPVNIAVRQTYVKFRSYDVSIPHLANLFQISYYEPINQQTIAKKVFKVLGDPNTSCIKVWNLGDPATIFAQDWDI